MITMEKLINHFPADLNILAACQPIYETLPGWSEDISGIRDRDALPPNTRKYLERIETLTETPVDIISVGPGRNQTIVINHPFDSTGFNTIHIDNYSPVA